jgi:hypothetical protein
MTERRDAVKELGGDVLAGDEQLDRLDAGRRRSVDEILPLGGEEPGLVAVLPGDEELPDELELLVVAGSDQA